MSLLDHLRHLFSRAEIPDEARRIFDRAQTPQDLLRGLDHLLTQNEVEFRELERELEKLEAREREEIDRVRAGAVDGRQKRNALLAIQRLRKQMENYENRLRIYDRNMNLHLDLIGKIQEIEAMKLRGVDEARIDRIVMDFEEALEKYDDTMHAAEVAGESRSRLGAKDERDLAALEREITGAAPAREAEKEPAAARPERPRREPLERVLETPPSAPAEADRADGEKRLELE